MWTFSVGRAWRLMMQTLPFIVLRCLVYFGITLAYILATGVGSGIGWGVGGFGDTDFRAAATVWGGFIGLGVAGAAMYLLREYILYIVKAGHIAVMVRLLDGQPMPEGQSRSNTPRVWSVSALVRQACSLGSISSSRGL